MKPQPPLHEVQYEAAVPTVADRVTQKVAALYF